MTAAGSWRTTYLTCWAAAMVPAGSVGLMALAASYDRRGELWWLLGAVGGALAGLAIAAGTSTTAWLHRGLRVLGPVLLAVGGVASVAMFHESDVQKQTGKFLAGLGEFVFALLGVAVAWTGGALWLAGVSGPRLAMK